MTKRLAIKTGEYTKDGNTKGEYVNVGVVLSGDNGEFLLLDPTVNLAGCLTKQNMLNHAKGKKTGDMVMCSIFDSNQQSQPQKNNNDDFNQDVPF